MKNLINETHDPGLTSWVESANREETDFPIQNLPFGVFTRIEAGDDDDQFSGEPSIGVAIGNYVLDVSGLADQLWIDILKEMPGDSLLDYSLNYLLATEPELMSEVRRRVSGLLRADRPTEDPELVSLDFLYPMDEVEMLIPVEIGNYTDYYASIHHATNVGKLFRPDNPLLPNYKWMPIGYHGRPSSIVLSGSEVRRPFGQIQEGSEEPAYGPSRVLDYELEIGFYIQSGNDLGQPIDIMLAEDYIAGLCLVNDWSARDIQRWEYQPLGPFLSKSFATSISPWIVTMEALAPFRVPAFTRPPEDPVILPHLDSRKNREQGGFDIHLEVYLRTQRMRQQGIGPHLLSRGNTRDLYWTLAQMVTHHTSNGCNLMPGDLIASGTVSGATPDSLGCLLELTEGGKRPIELPSGEERRFLEDGDEVILRGYCQREGFRSIGFGTCRGVIV